MTSHRLCQIFTKKLSDKRLIQSVQRTLKTQQQENALYFKDGQKTIRMAKILNPGNTKFWQGLEQQELLFIAGENAKWYSHFGRQFGSFLEN